MRTVSACAWARVQSRLNAAAAAAEFLSSVLREVGIVSSPNCCFRLAFLAVSILGPDQKSDQHFRALSIDSLFVMAGPVPAIHAFLADRLYLHPSSSRAAK